MGQYGIEGGLNKLRWKLNKDMLMIHVTEKMVCNRVEWKKMIQVATPKIWEKGFVVGMFLLY